MVSAFSINRKMESVNWSHVKVVIKVKTKLMNGNLFICFTKNVQRLFNAR